MKWTALHIFGYAKQLVYKGSGSGDKAFDYVLAVCLMAIAILVTALWSALDPHRPNYTSLHRKFRVFVRFALAAQLTSYGLVKIIPVQMPFPSLARLVQPFGTFSPMGVLWSSIGAAPGYERFAGCAEFAAGLLLLLPATAMLGALLTAFDLVEVFALNMTYDIPVKLFSFHLLLFALLLLAPEWRRFFQFCFVGCSVDAPSYRSARRSTLWQAGLGLLLVSLQILSFTLEYRQFSRFRARSPLYGIWDVEPTSAGGRNWRRLILDSPGWLGYQTIAGDTSGMVANYQEKAQTMDLRSNPVGRLVAHFKVQRPSSDRLLLTGSLDGGPVTLTLTREDLSRYPLLHQSFHWIQDYPLNR